MALPTMKTISAGNVFELRERPRQYYASQYIREYVTNSKLLKIDPSVIQEIIQKFALDRGGNDLHKIRFNNGNEVIVNDAGLSQAIAA